MTRAVFSFTYLLFIFLFYPVFGKADTPTLNWNDSEHSVLRVNVPGREQAIRECVDSGFQVRFRFYLELCRARTFWFDKCYPVMTSQKTLSFDAIGDQYRLNFDIFDDQQEPQDFQLSSREDAIEEVARVAQIKLIALSTDGKISTNKGKINLRIKSDCRSALKENLSQVSSLLSLGIIQVHRYDSGWISFPITDFNGQRDK
jgi:hypothetical protein